MKTKNKLLISIVSGLLALVGATSVPMIEQTAKAEETPTLRIVSNNVSYAESMYILYAVGSSGFDRATDRIEMLFWDEPQTDYTYGTQTYISTSTEVATVKGESCVIFYSDGLAAKEMTDDVFARAYVEVDGEAYYSDVMKYSVLEYIYTQKEKSLNAEKATLFNAMLAYGAAAQNVFDYNLDRLANDTYYKIAVENGTLQDGFAQGRYKMNDALTLKADAPEGKIFSHWENSNGEVVGEEAETQITVAGAETYTAVYDYNINFYVGTELYYTVSTCGGEMIAMPSDPSLMCVFDGWFIDKDIWAEEITENSFVGQRLTSDLDVYANFTEHYTIVKGFEYVDSITLINSTSYPFVLNDGVYTSSNKVSSSKSTFEIRAIYNCELVLGYKVSSEANYDKLIIQKNASSVDTISGDIAWKTKNITLSAGDIVTIQYSKDGSVNKLNDTGYFKIVSCTQTAIPADIKVLVDESVAKCIEDIVCDCREVEIKALGHDEQIYQAQEPTCTEIGWNDYVVCSRCDYTTYKEISALGHQLNDFGECTMCDYFVPGSVGLEYTLSSDGTSYSVTGIGTCKDTDLVIPSTYNGLPVTSIGEDAFYECSSLTSVEIPDSVTSIGRYAFFICESLTSVVIPDSVTSIGSRTFSGCSSLTSVVIPDSVTSIGEEAFSYCYSLTSVVIGDSVTIIGSREFSYCSSLTSVVIGDSVTIIGWYAFEECRSLTSIEVSENNSTYKSIDGNVYTKDGKTLIQYAKGKTAKSFTIPDSVTSIGSRTFSGCHSLTSVVIPDSVTSIGDSAFEYCDSLTSVVIPDNVTSIGWSAFEDCRSLTSVVIPDSVTSIGPNAFQECTSLTSVVIGDSVTSIGGAAFYECSSLTSVVIPDSVTSIGESAFFYCFSLTSVVIPDSVTSIGEQAFCSSYNLTIYCEAASQPSGWHSNWNYDNCPVVWNYR